MWYGEKSMTQDINIGVSYVWDVVFIKMEGILMNVVGEKLHDPGPNIGELCLECCDGEG